MKQYNYFIVGNSNVGTTLEVRWKNHYCLGGCGQIDLEDQNCLQNFLGVK